MTRQNPQETRLSETLTYVRATLQDILERVFVLYFADGLYLRVRGPAATQASGRGPSLGFLLCLKKN